MARRGRSIDHSYKHTVVVMKPLIAARSNWQDDPITAETLALAAGLVPETPAAPEPPAPVPAKPRKAKKAVKAKSAKPKKAVKAPVKFSGKLAWSATGQVLGWQTDDPNKIEPLSLRPTKKEREQTVNER